jgi:hypothetical protein
MCTRCCMAPVIEVADSSPVFAKLPPALLLLLLLRLDCASLPATAASGGQRGQLRNGRTWRLHYHDMRRWCAQLQLMHQLAALAAAPPGRPPPLAGTCPAAQGHCAAAVR